MSCARWPRDSELAQRRHPARRQGHRDHDQAAERQGSWRKYRVVHFATHGALAGEIEMLAPPSRAGLILTPPTEADRVDDGYLTASEVAALKLDADWVILSACNTAAGGARARKRCPAWRAPSSMPAPARCWCRTGRWTSAATVKLITKAFDELQAHPKIGRAEALRRSMTTLLGAGGAYAHPANWAPFIVVGEGAR